MSAERLSGARLAAAAVVVLLAPASPADGPYILGGNDDPTRRTSAPAGPQHARFHETQALPYSDRFAVEQLALSGDGREVVATARSSRLGPRGWDTATGRSVTLPEMSPTTTALALSADGRWLAGAVFADVLSSERGGVSVWDRDGGRPSWLEGGDDASVLAFDGRALLGGNGRGVVRWDLPATRPRDIAQVDGGVDAITMLADGDAMVAAAGGGLLLRLAADGAVLDRWEGPPAGGPVAISPDGRLVVIGQQEGFRVIDLLAGGSPQVVPVPGLVTGVAWAASGRTFAAGTDKGQVHVFAVDGVDGIAAGEGRSESRAGSERASPPGDGADGQRGSTRSTAEQDGLDAFREFDDRRGENREGGESTSLDVRWTAAVAVMDQMGGDPRTPTSIEAAMRKNGRRLEGCWKRAARAGPVKGVLEIALGVSPDGEGVGLDAPSVDTLQNTKLTECVCQRMREPIFGTGLGELDIVVRIELSSGP